MAKRTFFQLYDVLRDYSIEPVEGKHQFGDLEHAKKRAVKDNRGRKITWHHDSKWGPSGDAWKGFNEHRELINIIVKRIKPQTLEKRNPTGKKKMAKKKRSAKQLANDRRLGRMAKKRAGKKKAKKKTTRKRNPKRTSLKKDHLWMIAIWNGKQLAFLHATSQWTNKAKGARFTTKQFAADAANLMRVSPRDSVAVVPDNLSNATIVKGFKDAIAGKA